MLLPYLPSTCSGRGKLIIWWIPNTQAKMFLRSSNILGDSKYASGMSYQLSRSSVVDHAVWGIEFVETERTSDNYLHAFLIEFWKIWYTEEIKFFHKHIFFCSCKHTPQNKFSKTWPQRSK